MWPKARQRPRPDAENFGGEVSWWPLPPASLFDHLVGAGEQRRRNLKAERLGGCQIDDELELGRLHHRQIGWLGAFQNAAGIDANLAINVREIGAVAHQAADFREFA